MKTVKLFLVAWIFFFIGALCGVEFMKAFCTNPKFVRCTNSVIAER